MSEVTTKLVRELEVGDAIISFDGKPLNNPSVVTRKSGIAYGAKHSGWFVFHGVRGGFLPTGSDDVRNCEVSS